MAFSGADESEKDLLWALRDVSFRLGRGQAIALIGPNGAGKTTVLKLLANITKATSGHVAVSGRLSALIELGAGFHPELTGRDNAYLNGAILGIGRRELQNRFDEIVDFSGLERFIDTPVKRYSSGMVVRLGFAVAACVDPEILLVDEVLAVGDATFSQKCLVRIRSLIEKGTAVVFVSHNLYLVKAVCQHGLYLRGGRVRLGGSTSEAIEAYERDLHDERTSRLIRGDSTQVEGAGQVEITAVEMLGADGMSSVAGVSSTERAQIRITYQAYAHLGRSHVSVFIRRSDGMLCCMLRTSLGSVDLEIERGVGVISLQFDSLQLVTGQYYAEAYFLDASDSLVLTPAGRRSAWFMVVGAALNYEQESGIFEPIVTWAHRSTPAHQAREQLP